ncbi:hypothetical protein QYE76_071824 [Lolium multiflorum]|uniref:Transposase (putative) gypsy type domain-containing protein n=1 Tax=Lolium multiflorum TaxID=4521 RepID=A0AAD8WH71_LOLMU|nr:hypothetical protein QYE76_071824 [Lolium multiflorum]
MAAPDHGTMEWERSKISNQDINLMKKKEALRFPSEESYPSPPIQYRLHQLTPNSILHVSIFITLCKCFLGVRPNWALWKRIFCLRRNGSHNIAYNIGGVVICVRPDIEYFDVKFPDSVKGWRRRWLIRVQPLQARKNPLWMYAGEEDVDRLSKDLEVKDLEKLVRRISSLSKKDAVPSTCRVKPYSGANALPKKHQVLASLPPLPEGGEVEERIVVTDEHQGTSRLESEVAGKTHQDYDLENPEGDRLLDALSLLEIHGDEARQGIADPRAGLLRLFPYFFAKKKGTRFFR